MTFSEYAFGLSPFISFGKSEHDYFTELVGNFVKDAAMDSCQMLKRRPDTKYRYINGSRPIQQKDAQYQAVFGHYGASVLTELNEKHSKIKGFRQSINGINLKIKYFSLQNTLRY